MSSLINRLSRIAIILLLVTPVSSVAYMEADFNGNGSGDDGGRINRNDVMVIIYEALRNGLPDVANNPIVRIEGGAFVPDSEGRLSKPKVWALKIEYKNSKTELTENFQLNMHYLTHVKMDETHLEATFKSKIHGIYSEEFIRINYKENTIENIKVFRGDKKDKYVDLRRVKGNQPTDKSKGLKVRYEPGDLFDWVLNSFVNKNNKTNRGDAMDHILIDSISFEHASLLPGSGDKMDIRSSVYRMVYRLKSNKQLGDILIKFDRYKVREKLKGTVGTLKAYSGSSDRLLGKSPAAVIKIDVITGKILSFKSYEHKALKPPKPPKSRCSKLFK